MIPFRKMEKNEIKKEILRLRFAAMKFRNGRADFLYCIERQTDWAQKCVDGERLDRISCPLRMLYILAGEK